MPRKKKTNNYYFSEKEQNALVEYLKSNDNDERNRLFNTLLYPAFTKMIECIIRRYELFIPNEEFENTFNDTFSNLMTKVDHYKPETGFKAYSYCGTICKNYVLGRVIKHDKEMSRNESFENASTEIVNNLKYSYEADKDKQEYLKALFSEIITNIEKMLENPTENKLKENDIKVGQALVHVFKDWDNLFARMGTDKFNRSSIVLYIQELTLLTASEVRNSLAKYKQVYKKIKSAVSNIYL